jgi:hypothetical protein
MKLKRNFVSFLLILIIILLFFNYNIKLYFVILNFNLMPKYSQTLGIYENMKRKTNLNTLNHVNITCEDEIAKE